MTIQKLQMLKIPDSLETALEYKGAERWICWYCDTFTGTLIIEDINLSYFGNQKAWLLFCSYIDANKTLNKSSTYNFFERLASGQYPYHEAHEIEAKVTESFSSSSTEKAYLFDRQTRELYSGSPTEIQALIKQPKTLVMWAELQDETYKNNDILSALPIEEEWILSESEPKKNLPVAALLKVAIVCFSCGVILFGLLTSVMNTPQSLSRFFLPPPSNSAEKLKAELAQLALENQTAELLTQKQPLRVAKKQKSECKTQPVNK